MTTNDSAPARLILWSLRNRALVVIFTLVLAVWGWVSLGQTPLDAIPDLSDAQVIVRTSWPGQSPRVIEDQVTYPLSSTLLSVPGARVVRGYSFFGDSYVYVIFEDGVDPYWARSRVLEYLDQAKQALPAGVEPALGPDASGVGWIFSYALVDHTGKHDIAGLRGLQDWFLKLELQGLPGVAEVASVGGMVREYQIAVDADKLRAHDLPLSRVAQAVRRANRESGGSVIEMGEREYMLRTRGYLRGLADIEVIPLGLAKGGVPILLRDVAHVSLGPEMRRVATDLDGKGEAPGGIVVMRHGANALQTIARVRERLDALRASLPAGVEVVTTYDRSGLILAAVDNLRRRLIEEFIVVALVCALFLFHLRSALVAVIGLPLGILVAFIIMRQQGIAANIMSLGGIAIAIGAMVDATIVMIENVHRHLERAGPGLDNARRWRLIADASVEVGPALFYSLLIITLSFVPVFSLQAQEGRMFAPLAWTKTFAMAAAAGLAVTLTPVLMGGFIRGRIPRERDNPLNRWLIGGYRPALRAVLRRPRATLIIALLAVVSMLLPLYGVGGLLAPLQWPARLASVVQPEFGQDWRRRVDHWRDDMNAAWRATLGDAPLIGGLGEGLGGEFMPRMFEGDLMYMPTTLPGISIGKARELLRQSDALIRRTPEVERVFGKVGRADTATDPAPLTMIETLIRLKPREQWRPGLTVKKLTAELDQRVRFPGLTNAWVMPVKTRIDMLSTGIKTPLGVRVSGDDPAILQVIGRRIESLLSPLPGSASVYAERAADGRYIDILPKRLAAARLGLNIDDIGETVAAAIGGIQLGVSVEGRERYPINLRLAREQRDDIEALKKLPLVTTRGAQVPLQQVADVHIVTGPPMLKSENARLASWVFIDIRDTDPGSYIHRARAVLEQQLRLPSGYSLAWVGQYQDMRRARERLMRVAPLTLAIIFVLLYLIFRDAGRALLVMLTLPLSLVGGFWLLWGLGYNLSVAVAVGFLALAGLAAEFGVVMLIYLDSALRRRRERGELDDEALREAIIQGAVLRVRPKAMTVAVIVAGLLPIMLGDGIGSEVMRRIAAPMIGGMITAPLLSLFVVPLIYYLWQRRILRRGAEGVS